MLKSYGQSITTDWQLYRHDIRGSIAHARALVGAGILSGDEFSQIDSGLRAIGEEIASGRFEFSQDLEDVHMNIESELTRRIGPAGAKLHTARSRNDQVALDFRMFLRDESGKIVDGIREFQRAIVGLASRHPDAILPGYTHLQRAQPVLFAHHLLAYVEMLDRDAGRIRLREADGCDAAGIGGDRRLHDFARPRSDREGARVFEGDDEQHGCRGRP